MLLQTQLLTKVVRFQLRKRLEEFFLGNGNLITNNSGGTLDSTEGNHLKIYQGVYGQTT